MKKTFTINISGSVFHIEEDAFEKLQNYLQVLNRYFASQVGGQEILQDIESRIAELLQEKIKEGKEAITIGWVDEVIVRMGNPEDFAETEQPQETEVKNEEAKKRMYRDSENRVLGGVCSGMSAYFNIDPAFLRILFVLLLFVGVGVSAIVYLILWIVVPKAQTTAQRLEMRGKDATITNIQKTIQEEVKEVKDSFSRMNKSDSVRKGKEFANKAGQASVQVFHGLGRVVGVILGSLLILTGFLSFVAFMVSFTLGNSFFQSHIAGSGADVNLSGLLGFVVSPWLVSLSLLLLVLLIGIPLLAILFVGTKLVFRYKTNNRLIGLGAFGIWLVALISTIVLTAGQVSNFSQKNTVSSGKALNCPDCKTLYLEIGNSPEDSELGRNINFDDFIVMNVNGEDKLAGHPRMKIEATDAKDFSVVVRKEARGKNPTEVQKNLGHIQYELLSKDSTLFLDPYFTIDDPVKWRKQEVLITVKVPKGKLIRIGKNLDRLYFEFDNINNIWTREMTGKTWEMTPEGLSLKE